MKTRLLLFLLFAFSFGNAQINISEGFESGALPAGWVNNGFTFFNNAGLAFSGNYGASAISNIGTDKSLTTTSQISNGNPMYVSIKVRKQANISGFVGLYYLVGSSPTLNPIVERSYGTPYSAYQTVSGTIATGAIPSGTSIKFVIRAAGQAGSAAEFLFDNFLVITNSTLGPLITDVSYTPFTNSADIKYSLNAFNAATTSVIKYGLSSSNLSSQVVGFSVSGNTLTTNTISITGLSPQTQYYYQIEATNSAGTTTSSIGTFTTSMPIAEYNFNSTYNNVNGNTPFSNRAGTTSFVTDRNGNPNGALQIIGNYVYGSNVALPLPSGNSVRTISLWYKSYVTGNGSSLFNYGVAQQYQNFGAYFGATGDIFFWGVNYDQSFGGTYPALVWRHLVLVYDGTNAKLYLDGSLINTIARPLLNTSSAGFLQLGNGSGATIDFDDLKIFNYELNSTEISNLHDYNTITTPTSPIISNIADNVTTSTATITYTLISANGPTTSIINYGLTSTNLSSQIAGFSTNNTTADNKTINGLSSNTTYYYQIESINSGGTTTSPIMSFTTLPQLPGIYSVTATAITANSASINYSLWDNALPTTSVVRYGLASGSLTNQVSGFSVSGDMTVAGNVSLTGLTPNTTYYYQVEATNSSGISTSAVASFTTLILPITIAEYTFDNTYNNINGNTPFANYPATTSFVADRNNVANKALQVLGNDAGTFSNLAAPSGASARTISFWYKTASHAGFKSLFSYGTATQYQTFGTYFGPTGNIWFQGFSYDDDFGGSYALNTWRHLVITFDGADVKLYLNGTLVGTLPRPLLNTGSPSNFKLGNNGVTMQFDDLKIYNYALEQADITSLYSSNTLSTSDFSQNNLEVALYPNPVHEVLNIETALELQSVEIYNLQGQKVLASTQKQINVSDLTSGMYMVRIEDVENASITRKIIIK